MNRIIVIFSLFTSSLIFSQNNKIDEKYRKMIEKIYTDFETIMPDEAQKLIGKSNTYFLDVREKNEFEISHIENANFVGFNDFDWTFVKTIPKDATLIIYCSIGARSQEMGVKLKNKGYKNIKNLYGGLFLWANQGRKMVDSKNVQTTKIHGYNADWSKWVKKGKVIY